MSMPHDEGLFARRSSDADSGELATVDLDDAMRPRPPGRGRAWRTALVVALVALVAAGILHTFTSGSGGGTASVSVLPTTTPNDPGLLVESNVNYGTLTLNGKPVSGAMPLIVKPRPGTNTLTLTAPPFTPHTCHLQWPDPQGSSTSGCGRGSTSGLTIQGQTFAELQTIQLDLNGGDLPPDLQTAALGALGQALDGIRLKTTVPAGDYIATGRDDQGHITSVRAAASLRAELAFTLTPPGQPGRVSTCGDILCGGSQITSGQDVAQTHLWSVSVPISAHWSFDNGSGAQATSVGEPLGVPITLTLNYNAAAGWQVVETGHPLLGASNLEAILRGSLCAGGFTTLTAIGQGQPLSIGQQTDHGVEGCLLVTSLSGDALSSQGTPQPDAGQFVWRFGVLLAANDMAHTLAPDLPLAPPDEFKTVAA